MKKYTRYLLIVLILVLPVLFIKTLFFFNKENPERLFQRVLFNPIPESVKKIKASIYEDRENNHLYVVGFEIDRNNFLRILNSYTFKEASYFDYAFGYLSCGDASFNNGVSRKIETASIHYIFQPEPKWVKIDEHFKAYALDTNNDLAISWNRLLIYNNETGQAYYFDEKIYNGTGFKKYIIF